MTPPLRVGLVGAGPWAAMVHAPMLAAGPETTLSGVWARRPEAAAALAGAHGAPAFATVEQLADASDAVAFAVAPDAQAALAPAVARAGRAVLLEKPIAADLAGAERVAEAVGEAGVGSLVVLSARFSPAVRAFLERAAALAPTGGRAWTLTSAFLAGPFSASPWRQERGTLLDVGPHALDLLAAAMGPIIDLHARRSAGDVVVLSLEHEGGAVSSATLCCRAPVDGGEQGIEVVGRAGTASLDMNGAVSEETWATVRREFATVARERVPHPCNAAHGLVLQRWLDRAERAVLA